MPSIIAFAGSPSTTSRSVALTEHLAERLRGQGHRVRVVRARDDVVDTFSVALPRSGIVAR